MNSVYVPVQVIVIIRRLANVLSTLSISNHYFLRRERVAEDAVEKSETQGNTVERPALSSWIAIHSLRQIEWPAWMDRNTWDWPHFLAPRGAQVIADSAPTNLSDIALRSFDAESNEIEPTKQPDSCQDFPPRCHLARHSGSSCHSPQPRKESEPESLDIIHYLMHHPALFDPIRRPRYPIVLCHGLYGFDVRGPSSFPSLRMEYWSNVLNILKKKVGAEVIVTAVPGTGSITSRSENLDRLLLAKAYGRGINLMAHSMGGLDCRHLISHVKPTEYTPLSLTTISTPHRGSPFMDWCAENIGLGRLRRQELENAKPTLPEQSLTAPPSPSLPPPQGNPKTSVPFSLSMSSLPSSFTTLLMSVFDSPAYSNLTSTYLNTVFNPSTPDDPRVKYFSVAGRTEAMSVWHPLWLPKMVVDGFEKKEKENLEEEWKKKEHGPISGPASWERQDRWGNDGLVTVQSARWGEFLGILEGCDHWEMRGARGLELDFDIPLGIGNNGASDKGEGWSFRDWGKFVGAWREQEQIKRREIRRENMKTGANISTQTIQEHDRKREQDDAVIKSSTDKLSAVFDWLVEQGVPAPPNLTSKDKSNAIVEIKQKEKKLDKKLVKNELATKMDLERFYVALSRKLYDEGL